MTNPWKARRTFAAMLLVTFSLSALAEVPPLLVRPKPSSKKFPSRLSMKTLAGLWVDGKDNVIWDESVRAVSLFGHAVEFGECRDYGYCAQFGWVAVRPGWNTHEWRTDGYFGSRVRLHADGRGLEFFSEELDLGHCLTRTGSVSTFGKSVVQKPIQTVVLSCRGRMTAGTRSTEEEEVLVPIASALRFMRQYAQ